MHQNSPSNFFEKSDQDQIKEFHLDELKEEAERDFHNIKGLFYLIPVPACITNQDREFEEVNEAYCQLYDYDHDDLIGQPFTMVVPEEAREEMGRMHDDFFENEHEFSGQWDVIRSDGSTRRVLSNAAYVSAEYYDHPLKITFVVDVTDLTSAQRNLQLTNELLSGKLAAQEIAQNLMVHDMRNPIHNIISLSEMLMNRPEDSRSTQWIELINRLARRLERQVKSTSDFAKMESGNYQLQTECFDLLTLVHQIIRAASGDMARRELSPRVNYQGTPVDEQDASMKIEADRFYIEQMLTNLLMNAIEASPKEEELVVDIRTESSLHIHLTNAGVVPPDIRDHLFEKNVTQGKDQGQGLGTYIARLVARQHDGDVTFETSDEKNRTTFRIELPLNNCESE